MRHSEIDGVGPQAPSARERSQAAEVSGHVDALLPNGRATRLTPLNWKLVAAITLLTTGVAWLIAASQTPRYQASALAAIAPIPEALAANEFLRGVEVLERRTVVVTVAALASTPATRRQVAADKDSLIEAVILPNTNLVRIDVDGDGGAQAAAIANRVPAVLDTQARSMFKYYGVTMVSPASAPTAPYLPRTSRAIMAGMLIGLFAGVLVAYAVARSAASRIRATGSLPPTVATP